MNKLNGFLYGLLSSASFGLIPLFTIPAMREGMNFESILFYRFLFACLALGCILLLDKQSFHIKRKEIPSLMLLAFLYLMSAVFLFWGYKFMASGVAHHHSFHVSGIDHSDHDDLLPRKEIDVAFLCYRPRSGRCLLPLLWRQFGRNYRPRIIYRPPVGFGICTLSGYGQPAQNRTDEGITAYFLCFPVRHALIAGRHRYYYRHTNHP